MKKLPRRQQLFIDALHTRFPADPFPFSFFDQDGFCEWLDSKRSKTTDEAFIESIISSASSPFEACHLYFQTFLLPVSLAPRSLVRSVYWIAHRDLQATVSLDQWAEALLSLGLDLDASKLKAEERELLAEELQPLVWGLVFQDAKLSIGQLRQAGKMKAWAHWALSGELRKAPLTDALKDIEKCYKR